MMSRAITKQWPTGTISVEHIQFIDGDLSSWTAVLGFRIAPEYPLKIPQIALIALFMVAGYQI
jgi:hypothetical protein